MLDQDIKPKDLLLFSIMESRDAFELAQDAGLKAKHFFGGRRSLFETVQERFNKGKSSKVIDLHNLRPGSELLEHLVHNVSGKVSPHLNTIPDYVEQIKTKSKRRHLSNIANELLSQAGSNEQDPDELLTSLRGKLDRFASLDFHRSPSTKEWMSQVDKYVEKTRGMDILGYKTGLPTLTKTTSGIQKGSFWVVGGQTNIGKTQFCQQIMLSAAREGAKALFISLELSTNEMGCRLLSMETKRGLKDIKTIDYSNNPTFQDDRERLEDYSIYLNDKSNTLQEILNSIIVEKNRHDIDLVVVDYIQNIMVEGKSTEYEALNQAVLSLQKLSLDKNIAIIAVSQLNRGNKMDQNAGLHHFKGSGNIENSADMAISLHKDSNNQVWCSVNKNRLLGDTASFKICKVNSNSIFVEGTLNDGDTFIPSEANLD